MKIQFREFFYVSNILSFLRIALILPMYYFLRLETNAGNYWAVFAMFLVAMTDWFDGYLARKFNQQSDFGRILDPIADKIAVAILVILLVNIRDLPLWYVVVVVGRDVLIMLLSLVLMSRVKGVVESNWLGKMTVFTLGVVIILFSLNVDMLKWIFLWISIGLVVVSSVSYFIKMKKILGKSIATV